MINKYSVIALMLAVVSPAFAAEENYQFLISKRRAEIAGKKSELSALQTKMNECDSKRPKNLKALQAVGVVGMVGTTAMVGTNIALASQNKKLGTALGEAKSERAQLESAIKVKEDAKKAEENRIKKEKQERDNQQAATEAEAKQKKVNNCKKSVQDHNKQLKDTACQGKPGETIKVELIDISFCDTESERPLSEFTTLEESINCPGVASGVVSGVADNVGEVASGVASGVADNVSDVASGVASGVTSGVADNVSGVVSGVASGAADQKVECKVDSGKRKLEGENYGLLDCSAAGAICVKLADCEAAGALCVRKYTDLKSGYKCVDSNPSRRSQGATPNNSGGGGGGPLRGTTPSCNTLAEGSVERACCDNGGYHQDGICIKKDTSGVYNACVSYGSTGDDEPTWSTSVTNCDTTLKGLDYTDIKQVNMLVKQIMDKAYKNSDTRFVGMTGPAANALFEGNKGVTISGILKSKQTYRTYNIKKTPAGSKITARTSFLETLLGVLGYAGVSGDVDDSAGKVNLAGNAAGALDTDKCDNINTILGGTGIFPGLKRAYLDTDLTGATPKCSFTFSKQ